MNEAPLESQHLRLVLQQPGELLAHIEAMSPADRAQVSPDWLARARAAKVADPWIHGFRMEERASGAVVGNCGYKGPPDSDGVVEIAYGVDPACEGRGYATQAAKLLVEFALGSGDVRIVRAHTLPENNASARVLTKCGFEKIGEVVDPEDGLVWRWELTEQPI